MQPIAKQTAWKLIVYSALAAARAKEAAEEAATAWKKKREQKKREDKLRRNIQSVWDALG